jgi:predicted Zn-dependent peptidase
MIFEERLRKELREELGGTYHVQVSGGFIDYPEELFHLECSFVSEPERMDELKLRMKSLLQEFQKEGPTQEEMDITTTKILRQLDEDEKEDSYWISLFSTVAKREKELADIYDLRQAIDDLDLAELHKIGAELLQWEDSMEVILLPQDNEVIASSTLEN